MWDFINNGWPIICSPTINISVFVLNGTNDNEFNYNGGYYPGVGNYLSVDSTVSFWTDYNSCIVNNSYTLPDINNDNISMVYFFLNYTSSSWSRYMEII